MFGINEDSSKKEKGYHTFDVKYIDDFVDRIKNTFERDIEKEIKEYLLRLKVGYKRDEQNAINTGITAKAEEKAKEWICPRIPKWVNSDMLTVLGVIGTVITALGFVLGFFNRFYLVLVILGLVLNWFGDSFDGSLARYRKNTRPNYGYYIDHVIDSIAVFIFGLGLGLSGFVKIELALLFVIVYLILMIHVELVTYVQNEFKYSFGIFGPTEVRIVGIVFTVVMFFVPVKYFNVYGHFLTQYDFGLGLGFVIFLLIIIFSILSKGIELDRIDRKR